MSATSSEYLSRLIDSARSIAALTGAGISTSAGIPDFRGPRGLYITKQYDADRIFDIQAFDADPRPFYAFARDFLALEETIQPTPAHRWLAQLERSGKLKGVITQNIDGLHQRAGQKSLLEIHGSFRSARCRSCKYPITYADMLTLLKQQEIPRCEKCEGVIKPDIVFFGEEVYDLDKAVELASSVDLFFIIGTSCAVYPAAMLPRFVQGEIAVLNQSRISLDVYNVAFDEPGNIDEMIAKLPHHGH